MLNPLNECAGVAPASHPQIELAPFGAAAFAGGVVQGLGFGVAQGIERSGVTGTDQDFPDRPIPLVQEGELYSCKIYQFRQRDHQLTSVCDGQSAVRQ